MSAWNRNGEVPPKCPMCGVDLLPRVGVDCVIGTGFWCPRDGDFVLPVAKRLERIPARPSPASTSPTPIRGDAGGFTFSGKVLRDATVEWSVSGAGTVEQLTELAGAACELAVAARRRRDQLSGADRWVFSRKGAVPFVSRLGEMRQLVPMTILLATGASCAACDSPISRGGKAFRAAIGGGDGQNPWTTARFCGACAHGKPTLSLVKTTAGERSAEERGG
jgi:hypothetical protein